MIRISTEHCCDKGALDKLTHIASDSRWPPMFSFFSKKEACVGEFHRWWYYMDQSPSLTESNVTTEAE